MDKTEVNTVNQDGPERVASAEARAKKKNLALTLYGRASSPLIDM